MKKGIIILLLIITVAISAFSVSAAAVSLNGIDRCNGVVSYIGDAHSSDRVVADTALSVEQGASPAAVTEDGEVEADGINTHVASIWIACISVVSIAGILSMVIVLAKRNKGEKVK